jgi:hypothetical protein
VCDLALTLAPLQLDQTVRSGAILASNTSSISITRIAAATKHPERCVGMHFMNPPPLMQARRGLCVEPPLRRRVGYA